jgi:hypothetical protein
MNQQPIAIRRTSKTKEDFLHWLREKKAFEKRADDRADHFDLQAVMVWADDGGQTLETTGGAEILSGD